MKTGYAVLIGAVGMAGLVGCGSGGRYESAGDAVAKSSSSSYAQAPMHTASRQPGADRSVIHTASMGVNVDDIKKAEKTMKQVVADSGGYIVHLESESLAGQEPTLRLTLRVPEKQFETVMTSLEGMGLATYKTISASDVTEQILDTEARLKQLTRDREILVRNGGGVAMNPGFESMKDRIRELTRQRDDLAGKASMSTIDLVVQQKPNAAMSAANASWGSDTWNAAVSSAMGAFRVVGSVLIWLLVYGPLWGLGVVGVLWARRYSRLRPFGNAAK